MKGNDPMNYLSMNYGQIIGHLFDILPDEMNQLFDDVNQNVCTLEDELDACGGDKKQALMTFVFSEFPEKKSMQRLNNFYVGLKTTGFKDNIMSLDMINLEVEEKITIIEGFSNFYLINKIRKDLPGLIVYYFKNEEGNLHVKFHFAM